MKRILKFLTLGVLSLLLAFCLASCGNNSGGKIELSIKESAKPNTVFVLGQDVNLDGGVLLVKEGDKVSEISMTDSEVSVSGYDKNTLGAQTVTITYHNKSVTLDITYVERIVVTDYTTDYLEGNELDLKKGKLKITRDNGTNYTMALSNSKVVIEGYDPNTIGEQTITVKYDLNSTTYTTSFKVTVYEIESIRLIPPSKISYKSHDTAVSVTGGQIVLSGKGGELESTVKVTEDMIRDFDLSVAKRDNSPCTHNVNVHYNGVDYPYEIKITYSNISDFRDVTKGLSTIDFNEWDNWSSTTDLPAIDDDLGAELVHVMLLYLDMSTADRMLLDDDDVIKAARAAIVWAYSKWYDDALIFSDAFSIVNGNLQLVGASADALKAAITGLSDTDRALYSYSDVIKDLATRFAKEKVCGNITFAAFPTIPNEDYLDLIELFEYMVDLDELFGAIPATWREDGVEGFGNEVEAIFDKIINGGYYGYAYAEIYNTVSSWRADAFDILFNYYYEQNQLEPLVKLSNVCLPGDLEQIFNYLYMAIECSNNIQYYNGDTTRVFYGYYMAEQLSIILLLGGDSMQKDLFYIIPLNGMLGIGNSDEITEYTFYNIVEYLRTMAGGCYYYSAGLLGNARFDDFMNEYMHILRRYNLDESYMASAEFGEDVEELLRLYMELTPTEQASLAVTLNIYYGTEYTAPYMFAAVGEYARFETQFAQLLRVYYQGLFDSEAGKNAYIALMVATEAYAQRYSNPDWRSVYNEKIALVNSLLSAMSPEEKQLFEEKLGYVMTKYAKLTDTATKHQSTTSTDGLDLKGWESEFEALHEALVFTELGMLYTQNNIRYFNLFLSAYERAEKIAGNILENAPPEVVEIFRFAGLYSNKSYDAYFTKNWVDTDPESTEYLSYEYVMSVFRSHYMNAINVNILGSSLYDDYFGDGKLREFIEKSYDLLIPFFLQSIADTNKMAEFDAEKMVDLFYLFSKLSTYEKIVFLQYMDDMDSRIFTTALVKFTEDTYTDNTATLIQEMINLEFAYMLYDYQLNVESSTEGDIADALATVKSRLETVKNAFKALTEEDATEFAPYVDLYNEIVSRTEEAIADSENT